MSSAILQPLKVEHDPRFQLRGADEGDDPAPQERGPFTGPCDDAMRGRIQGPLRVLLAEREALDAPARAAMRAATIRGAAARIIAGAGHLPPIERPAEVPGAIL